MGTGYDPRLCRVPRLRVGCSLLRWVGCGPVGHDQLLLLAGVGAVGIVAQWLAWWLRLPSILVLLGVGAALGATDVLDPDELLGDLLFPVVSLSVALILFEGSLGLVRRELKEAGRATVLLCTLGAAITFLILWLVATRWLEVDRGGAALGATCVVDADGRCGDLY